MSIRQLGAVTEPDHEADFPDEDPLDEFLASASLEEKMQALDPAAEPSGPERVPADEHDTEPSVLDAAPVDEGTPVEESNPYLDFDLTPGDIRKLAEHGVRSRDAVDAGLTRVTSSESALNLNRLDTGNLGGILLGYQQFGSGVTHCRVLLDTPVILKTSKGRRVPILQPVNSTNHLYFVPGTTQGVLGDSNVSVLLCTSEMDALAALQLQNDGQPAILPVGMGGVWGWRKTSTYEDPDGGETKVEYLLNNCRNVEGRTETGAGAAAARVKHF